jgi:hypothetical protein
VMEKTQNDEESGSEEEVEVDAWKKYFQTNNIT